MATSPLKLWYRTPAGANWNNALPVGSGCLGAMIFGNIISERIALNEDSLWNGGPRDRVNPDARRYLPDIREHIANGKLSAAQQLINDALPGIPDSMRCYEPLGDLLIEFRHAGYVRTLTTEELANAASCASGSDLPGGIQDYRRELDLHTAIAGVSYSLANVKYRRQYIASAADQIIAIHFEADKPGQISFSLRMERGPRESYSTRYADVSKPLAGPGILMTGKAGGEDGVSFAACLMAHANGGTIKTIGETLIVENANSATLYLAASTSFREKSPAAFVQQHAQTILSQGWQKILNAHLAEYQPYFNRVELSIENTENTYLDIATDELLSNIREGRINPQLAALYFQFGRYLLIASSRPGSLPATLQGIWNQDFWPAWGSKYTININTEMNYWPAEMCALPECHAPLFDMLKRVAESGRHTAKAMYGCRGFVCHHNTDLWADTCPTDRNLVASYWPMGGAWLSLHLWEHFDFNRDHAFLQNIAYPILKQACEFYLDFLIEDSQGRLVVSPSSSPENVYKLPNGEASATCMGATMDSAILNVLFRRTLSAIDILSKGKGSPVDPDFRSAVASTLSRLPQPAIGKHGQLMEWSEDYEETDLRHRHVSHLFTLHPGDLIHPRHTPDLAQAARVTLKRRGDEGTGWSIAWKINFWARLHEGQRALDLLKNLLYPVEAQQAGGLDIQYGGGGSYNNLFCAHPPFQIDGNFGGTSAIGEMFLQSHMTASTPDGDTVPEIELLPALPPEWQAGEVSGMRARGGFVINMTWRHGSLQKAVITAIHGGPAVLRYGHTIVNLSLKPGETKVLNATLN